MTGTETVSAIPSLAGMALKTCGVLLVVIACLLAVLWALKRLSGNRIGQEREMTLLETLAIGPKERLVRVRVRDRELVLGVTPQGIRTLDRMDRGEEP